MSTELAEWKKFAAQTVPDTDVEKAFLDQAYNYIQNKATPIMRAPYRIGFEIVHKNDDNTRMVGIFIFRINRDLFYAPVFFINGQIKGTDLFYRHSTKTFVPLNNDWTDYLLHMNPQVEGQGVPPSVRMNANNHTDLISIIQPPQYRKMASVELEPITEADRTEAKTIWTAITEKAASVPSEPAGESILKKFIVEDGGYNAIQKLAKAAKNSFEFANALFMASDEASFAPDLAEIDGHAGEIKPDLAIHFDPISNPGIKAASAVEIRQGYVVEDNRKEANLNTVVYAPAESTMEAISEAGIYNVLMADGSKKECLVANRGNLHADKCPPYMSPCGSGSSTHRAPELVAVDLDTRHSANTSCYRTTYGEFIRGIEESPELKDTMESGNAYRIYSVKAKALVGSPIYVKSVGKTDAGLTKYMTGDWDTCEGTAYIQNPDYEGAVDHDNVLGKFYKFVQVNSEKKKDSSYRNYGDDIPFGDSAAIDRWIYDNGFKKASIQKTNACDYIVRRHETEKFSPPLTKMGAKFLLMNECDMTETVANDVLDMTDTNMKYACLYKSAQQLQWRQFPEFYQQFNDEFSVPQEDADTQHQQILAMGNYPVQPKHRVGDAIHHEAVNNDSSPSTQDIDLSTAQPMELYGLSQEKGMSNMFEHGVVGSLVKTYDAIAMVEKYLPDMEQCLDRLGRVIFLLYWKPEDFVKAYGSDDQNDLENKLLSNFKSLGELVLELLMKSQQTQNGSSTMGQ